MSVVEAQRDPPRSDQLRILDGEGLGDAGAGPYRLTRRPPLVALSARASTPEFDQIQTRDVIILPPDLEPALRDVDTGRRVSRQRRGAVAMIPASIGPS
jgi:hypothetical protein